MKTLFQRMHGRQWNKRETFESNYNLAEGVKVNINVCNLYFNAVRLGASLRSLGSLFQLCVFK
jgi:hypothetical protein